MFWLTRLVGCAKDQISKNGSWKISEVNFRVLAYRILFVEATRLQGLCNDLQKLRAKAVTSTTVKTRRSQWRSFISFCKEYRLTALPATEHTVSLYVAFLGRNLEFSTVKNYVFSLIPLHHAHDVAAPDLSHFSIKEALSGLQRSCEELPNRRALLLPRDLLKMHHVLPSVEKNVRYTFWADATVAFHSLLRSANLLLKPLSDSHLLVRDLTFTEYGAVLSVKVLKTNRFLTKRIEISLTVLGRSHPLCPVTALKRMLKRTKAGSTDALFSYFESGCLKPMSPSRFNTILLSTTKLAGISNANVSTHLFRRGAATFASSMGILPDALKSQGNWRSSCYERYIHRDKELRKEFTEKFADALKR